MAKVIKSSKKVAIKKSKKELLEEAQNANDVAVANQIADVVASADENAIAVDTSSLSHFAAAETVAIDAVVGTAVETTATAATVGGMSLGTIALGTVAAVGGVVAAASNSTSAEPTEPADTGSITYYRVVINEEQTYYNDDGSISYTDPAMYNSIGSLSGGKDIDLSTLTGMPNDFVGLDGKADTGVNEIKLTLTDVLSKGYEGTNENHIQTSFFAAIGGSEDIVDIDLENWTDEGIQAIKDAGSLNGNYHVYTANGAELMILEGMQVI